MDLNGFEFSGLANYVLIRKQALVIAESLAPEAESLSDSEISYESTIGQKIRSIVNSDPTPLTMMEKGILLQFVRDELFGFGILGSLIRDPSVSAIYVYAPEEVHVTRKTGLEKPTTTFEDQQHLQQTINRILRRATGSTVQLSEQTPTFTCTLDSIEVIAALVPRIFKSAVLLLLKHVPSADTDES